MRSSGPIGTVARQQTGRLPLILLGDSDVAQGYVHADSAPANVRYFQPLQEMAHNIYCHQGENNPTVWITQNDIGPLGPVVGTGIMRWSYFLDLGVALTSLSIPVTMLNYAKGGSTYDDYSPVVNPSGYQTRLNWIKARLAQMPGHLEPILITDQGCAGEGSRRLDVAMAENISALRTDLGYPNMRVILIRIPWTLGPFDGSQELFIQRQNDYAATDPLSKLAYHDGMTYVDDTTLAPGLANGRHFDVAGGRTLALGPDGTNVRSVLTALTEHLHERTL